MNNHFLEFVQTRGLISLVNDNRVDNNRLVYVCISLIVNNRSKWFILFTTTQMLWKVLVYGFFHPTLVDTFVYLFNLFQKLGARVLFSEVGPVIIQLVVFFCSGFRVPLCRLLCFIFFFQFWAASESKPRLRSCKASLSPSVGIYADRSCAVSSAAVLCLYVGYCNCAVSCLHIFCTSSLPLLLSQELVIVAFPASTEVIM